MCTHLLYVRFHLTLQLPTAAATTTTSAAAADTVPTAPTTPVPRTSAPQRHTTSTAKNSPTMTSGDRAATEWPLSPACQRDRLQGKDSRLGT